MFNYSWSQIYMVSQINRLEKSNIVTWNALILMSFFTEFKSLWWKGASNQTKNQIRAEMTSNGVLLVSCVSAELLRHLIWRLTASSHLCFWRLQPRLTCKASPLHLILFLVITLTWEGYLKVGLNLKAISNKICQCWRLKKGGEKNFYIQKRT